MNKLQNGMRFKNMVELCDYIGWKYDYKHSARLSNKLREYVDFHREKRNTIIIDSVFNENMEMVQFAKRRTGYDYNTGDIVDVNNGQVKIIEQTHKVTGDGRKRKSYKAKCLKCGYEYIDYDYNFYKGIGCGCCNGKVIVDGINDMLTTNPSIKQYLLNEEDGHKYTAMSGKKIDFKCPICDTIYRNKAINNIAMRGLNCICSGSKSYPNRFMYWLLTDLNVYFQDEKVFDWAIDKRYDFFVQSHDLIIEMHGRQHYDEALSFIRKPLKFQTDNDKEKRNLAMNNGVKTYIEINSSYSTFEYIKTNVLKSELSRIFDLSNVNWNEIEKRCESNILEEIASLWNKGMRNATEIGNVVGLTKSPVQKFLHKCEKFGLIESYDRVELEKMRKERVKIGIYQSRATPIMCNENEMVFGSLALVKEKMNEITGLKFSHSNILGTITGRYSHHHHFTFSHITKQQFNEIKSLTPEKAFGDFFILQESQSA